MKRHLHLIALVAISVVAGRCLAAEPEGEPVVPGSNPIVRDGLGRGRSLEDTGGF